MYTYRVKCFKIPCSKGAPLKNKSVLIIATLLVCISLSCGIQPSPNSSNYPIVIEPTLNSVEAQATRQSLITQKATLFQEDYSWQAVPQTCVQSMAKIWTHSSINQDQEIASTSVINASIFANGSGNSYFVYQLLIADHSIKSDSGELLNGHTQISPLNSNIYLDFDFLSYNQVFDTNSNALDLGILTIGTLSNQSILESYGLIPIGTENIKSAYELSSNNGQYYYSLDYANGNYPQFTVFTLYKPGETPTKEPIYIAEIVEGSSTISVGSSGGAICDQGGYHIGVVSRYSENWETSFRITPNPTNIVDQIKNNANSTEQILNQMGYTKAPE